MGLRLKGAFCAVALPIRGGRDKRFGQGGVAKVRVPVGAGSGVEPAAVEASGRVLLVRVKSTTAALDPQGRLLVAAAGTGEPEESGNGYVLARFLLGPSA